MCMKWKTLIRSHSHSLEWAIAYFIWFSTICVHCISSSCMCRCLNEFCSFGEYMCVLQHLCQPQISTITFMSKMPFSLSLISTARRGQQKYGTTHNNFVFRRIAHNSRIEMLLLKISSEWWLSDKFMYYELSDFWIYRHFMTKFKYVQLIQMNANWLHYDQH